MNFKMPLHKLLLYTCVILLTSSCATLKQTEVIENKIELTKENLHLLDGTYENNEAESAGYLDYFWGSYFKSKESRIIYDMKLEEKPCYYITLKVINKKRISATLHVNETYIKSYLIKGKIKKGYFEQNRKGYFLPAILLNQYHSSKFRIGLLNNNNVITDSRKIEFTNYYFFSFIKDNHSYYNLQHQKI